MTEKISGAIRGTTAACLKHITETVGALECREQFCEWDPKANRITVRQWFVLGTIPEGDRLLKLQAFLERAGYTITEIEDLLPEVHTLRAAIVDGRISVTDIQKRIGYTGHSTTYQMLHGRTKPNGVYLERVRKIAAELQKPRSRRESEPVAHAVKPTHDHEKSESPVVVSSKRAVKDATVPLIQSLLPLAEAVISDHFTANDREDIRERVGNDGVFRLKNLLARLCGERARENL